MFLHFITAASILASVPLVTYWATVLIARLKQNTTNADPELDPEPADPEPEPDSVFRSASARMCWSIIACEPFDGCQNYLSRDVSRVLPFGKAQIAFGIENPYTCTDVEFRRTFIRETRRMMALDDEDWRDLSSFITRVGNNMFLYSRMEVFNEGGMDVQVNLTTLVQVITMDVVLWVFFGTTGVDFNQHDMTMFVAEVNAAIQSTKSIEALTRFTENDELKDALTNILRNYEFDFSEPRENPFNIILPAYEPLWRASLSLLVELAFGAGDAEWEFQDALIEYSQNSTCNQFEDYYGKSGVSPCDIVSESLRLYPPVPEIWRTYQLSDQNTKMTEVCADIGALQTSEAKFGEDAKTFNPQRFKELTPDQLDLCGMSFGSYPFMCPAFGDFGRRIVGSIVGSLLPTLFVEDEPSDSPYRLAWQGDFKKDEWGQIDMQDVLENELIIIRDKNVIFLVR